MTLLNLIPQVLLKVHNNNYAQFMTDVPVLLNAVCKITFEAHGDMLNGNVQIYRDNTL